MNDALAPESHDHELNDSQNGQDDEHDNESQQQQSAKALAIVSESPSHYDDSTSYPDHSEGAFHEGSAASGIAITEVPASAANNGDGNEVRVMAKRATQHIRFWRIIVLVTLLTVGIAASCAVWFGLKYWQRQQQDTVYWGLVTTAADTALARVQQLLSISESFSSGITSTATGMNLTFPLVTFPWFDGLAQQARRYSGIVATIYSPLISDEDRLSWERYSVSSQDEWLSQQQQGVEFYESIFPYIYTLDTTRVRPLRRRTDPPGPYLPHWQTSPRPINSFAINQNRINRPHLPAELFESVLASQGSVLTDTATISSLMQETLSTFDQLLPADADPNALFAYLVEPVWKHGSPHPNDHVAVSFLQHVVPLETLVEGLLPPEYTGLHAVLENTRNQSATFRLFGKRTEMLGAMDLHEADFSYTAKPVHIFVNDYCNYTLTLYSSQEFQSSIQAGRNIPTIATAITAVLFLCLLIGFTAYDSFVSRRNRVVINAAARSNAILSSLFPSNVRERLLHRANDANIDRTESVDGEERFEEGEEDEITVLRDVSRNSTGLPRISMGKRGSMLGSVLDMGSKVTNTAISSVMQIPKLSLKTFLFEGLYDMEVEEADDDIGYKGKPIADLFTETTILFADIAGFTAWSSVREPTQVFTLLETVYRAFDEIAKKRRVFKVETVGDCYVAVAGLPEPQKDHAVIMCRFARDCMLRMKGLTKKLEKSLGPDTGELDMRVGIHSGPVTAGVLRGERSRFQLFGDSMNTASRMESTGTKGRIQLSIESAALLSKAGKGHWVIPREDKVVAKGKGEMQTYWLTTQREKTGGDVECYADSTPSIQFSDRVDNKTASLIEWNTDVLLRLLRQIKARRMALQQIHSGALYPASDNIVKTGSIDEDEFTNPMRYVIDEVKEIINLPNFDYKSIERQIPPESVVVEEVVIEQLHDYVSKIANMYHDNFFHNFEHASHVTMSVTKLLSRIVAPSDLEVIETLNQTGKTLHDHTYGITSDPLTQFACVFSALIHDVDHHGVTNAQLIKEKKEVALIYKGKSVAEQNSINLAWNLLMQQEYQQLRECIYTSESSFKRFRQLVVNTVLATDIVDKDLKDLRNARWAKAFYESHDDDDPRDTINRKATIVIEHLIQASDVSHTMQHWHIYRKWNERFFLENFKSYHEGRSDANPASTWYKGEIGFFDFYIIPLAKKLKDCGVFGVSSDEYLNYAERNRKEWEERGEEVVQEMVIKANKIFDRRNSLGESRRCSNDSQRRPSNDSVRRSSNGSQNRRASNDSIRRTSNEGRRESNGSQHSSHSIRGRRSLRQQSSGSYK